MIERYIQITCDVCGEVEWGFANVSMHEFLTQIIPLWKHRGPSLAMCPRCVKAGKTWADATLHAMKT